MKLPENRWEGQRVAASFLFFFLLMVCYYLLKPVRSALLVDLAGADALARGNLLVLAATLVTVAIYDALMGRFPRRVVAPASILLFVGMILVFRVLWPAETAERSAAGSRLALLFFVWVSVFNVFTVMTFWSLANGLFTTGEASRLFGLVGAGGITGALVGSVVTSFATRALGTANLLVLAALMLFPCTILATWMLDRSSRDGTSPPDTGNDHGSGSDRPVGGPSGFRLVASSRYLMGLFLLVLGNKLVNGIFDYQYHALLEEAAMDRGQTTAFTGRLFLGVNSLGVLVQVLLVGVIQHRYGPGPGVTALPVVCAAGLIVLLETRALVPVAVVSVVGQALMYSLYQASRELLYVPTGSEVKLRAKAVIDPLAFRIGTALASMAVIVAQTASTDVIGDLAWFGLAACVLWLGIGLVVCQRYQRLVLALAAA